MATRRQTGAKPKPATAPSPKPSGRGGARPGAGRKRDVVPPEVMERVGPLPPATNPLGVSRWWQCMIGEIAILRATTGRYGELSRDMANLSAAAMRAMPLDAIREANAVILDDEKRMKNAAAGPKEHDAGQSGALAISRNAP